MLKQELLEDPSIISAIDEETEFNALVVCNDPLRLEVEIIPSLIESN